MVESLHCGIQGQRLNQCSFAIDISIFFVYALEYCFTEYLLCIFEGTSADDGEGQHWQVDSNTFIEHLLKHNETINNNSKRTIKRLVGARFTYFV